MQKDFSYPLIVENLTQQQQHYHLVADQEQLEALKEVLQVEGVKSFEADVYLKLNLKLHRLDVWGCVEAALELQSVVSLKNFVKKYSAPFEFYYDTKLTYKDIREMEPDIDAEIPDVIENGQIDLGNIAIEQLALQIEDYPRQKGEKFAFECEFDEETTQQNNPFAVLEKLKK